MLQIIFYLIVMLVIILMASHLFTNALEHIGDQLAISAGVTGSLLAAVATALPETLIPMVAIMAGTASPMVNEQISVGAIVGAPLMLSTLSTGIMALFALPTRGFTGKISPEKKGFLRDLHFFLLAFFLAAFAMYLPLKPWIFRAGISVLLVMIYFVYIILTLKASKQLVKEGHGVSADEPIYLTKLGFRPNTFTMLLQILLALIFLIGGAKGFINGMAMLANVLAVSPLILSLLIIPVATELPEKINSIIWIRKRKDTLAFGNITGALVFQGTLLPALGILLTPWMPVKEIIIGFAITFAATLWLRLLALKQGLLIAGLLLNLGLYVAYFYCVTR